MLKILNLLVLLPSLAWPLAVEDRISSVDRASRAAQKLLDAENLSDQALLNELRESWLALNPQASAVEAQLKQDLQTLGAHANYLALIKPQLENSQKIYFQQFYHGLMLASLSRSVVEARSENIENPKMRWLVEILTDAYFKLYTAEIDLQHTFGESAELNCTGDTSKLPAPIARQMNEFCEGMKRNEAQLGLPSRTGYSEVAEQADKAFQFVSARGAELRKMRGALGKDNPAFDADLLANADYARGLTEIKSCLATLFNGSGTLNPMLRKSYDYDFYYRVFVQDEVRPQIPRQSPIDEKLWESQINNLNRTRASEAKRQGQRLNYDKQRLIEQSKKYRAAVIDNIRQVLAARDTATLDTLAVSIVGQFPHSAGMFFFLLPEDQHIANYDLLLKSADYFRDMSNRFGDQTLMYSLVLIGSMFIPVSQEIVIAGVAVRAGTIVYSLALTGQTITTLMYISTLAELNSGAQAEEIFPNKDPFQSLKASQIEDGLRVGYLSLALTAFGESLGLFRIGEGVISTSAAKFMNWIRYSVARQQIGPTVKGAFGWPVLEFAPYLKRVLGIAGQMDNLTTAPISAQAKIEASTAFAKTIQELKRPGPIAMPQTQANFRRAQQLVQYAESNPEFQNLIRETVLKFSSEADKKIYLENVIRDVLLNASIGATTGLSRQQFHKLAVKAVERIYANYLKAGKFTIAERMFTMENRQAVANQMARLEETVKAFQRGEGPATATFVIQGKEVITKMTATLAKSQYDNFLQYYQGIQTAEGMFPFVKALADTAVKQNQDVLEKLAADPRIQKVFFAPRISGPLPGRSPDDYMFYVDKALKLAEVVDDSLIRAAATGGRTYEAIRDAAEQALEEMNTKPLATAFEILEVNNVISRLILRNASFESVSKEFYNPANVRNCAIN